MAGLAAGVSAARAGAATILVERRGALGGMATSALVHTLCGIYKLRDHEEAPLEFANTGFPQEFAMRLMAMGGARGPVRMGRLDVLQHSPAALAYLADQITAELPQLTVYFHTSVTAIDTVVSGRVGNLSLQTRGQRMEVETEALVDASGDAEASLMAGAAFECAPSKRLQRPAIIFGLCGALPGSVASKGRLELAHLISSAVSAGHLPREMLGISFREGWADDDVWVTLDMSDDTYDPCNAECLSHIEREGRRLAFTLVAFLRCHAGGFSQSRISITPLQAGIRESRRVVGLACLTAEVILAGAGCPDPAALTSWPLELRETARGPRLKFPVGNHGAGIPAGCLQARDFTNLFVAGRCISCSHEAQASIRVTGTCLATGESAGKRAAAAADIHYEHR